jgi:hypothetical protein
LNEKIVQNFNNFSIIGQNIMKHQLGALLLIEGFPTIPRAWQEVPWFGISEHDKQNNQPTNFPSKIDYINKFSKRETSLVQ